MAAPAGRNQAYWLSPGLRAEEKSITARALGRAAAFVDTHRDRPATLHSLCVRKAAAGIYGAVKAVRARRDPTSSSRLWESPDARAVRELVASFPRVGVVDDVRRCLFDRASRKVKPVNPELAVSNVLTADGGRLGHFGAQLKCLEAQTAFLLWWMFLDEELEREIWMPVDYPQFFNGFNDELVSLLVKRKLKNVHTLCIRYNFILKFDYIQILQSSLPSLRHVVLHQNNISGSILQVFCRTANKLSTFQIEGTRLNARYCCHDMVPVPNASKLSASDVAKFLRHQDELVEFNFVVFSKLLAGRTLADVSEMLKAVKGNDRMAKIATTSEQLAMLTRGAEAYPSVEEVFVDATDEWEFDGSAVTAMQKLVKIDENRPLSTFPNLTRLRLLAWFGFSPEDLAAAPVRFLSEFPGSLEVNVELKREEDALPEVGEEVFFMETVKRHFSRASKIVFSTVEDLRYPDLEVGPMLENVTHLDFWLTNIPFSDFMSLLFFPPRLKLFRMHHRDSRLSFGEEFLRCCKDRCYRGFSMSRDLRHISVWWTGMAAGNIDFRPICAYNLMLAASGAGTVGDLDVASFTGWREAILIRDFEGNGQFLSTAGTIPMVLVFEEKRGCWLTTDLRRLWF